jgi:hypothetical protein
MHPKVRRDLANGGLRLSTGIFLMLKIPLANPTKRAILDVNSQFVGARDDGPSSRDRTIGAPLAPHAQYAAMLDMHGFYGRSGGFRF